MSKALFLLLFSFFLLRLFVTDVSLMGHPFKKAPFFTHSCLMFLFFMHVYIVVFASLRKYIRFA